jgi:hypothetical protein
MKQYRIVKNFTHGTRFKVGDVQSFADHTANRLLQRGLIESLAANPLSPLAVTSQSALPAAQVSPTQTSSGCGCGKKKKKCKKSEPLSQ